MGKNQTEIKKLNSEEVFSKILTEEKTQSLLLLTWELVKEKKTPISFFAEIITILENSLNEFSMHIQTQLIIKLAHDLVESMHSFIEIVKSSALDTNCSFEEKMQAVHYYMNKEQNNEIH